VDQYVKRNNLLESSIMTLYSLVWGQCTDAMQAKLEASPDYDETQEANDGIELLKLIKTIAFNFQSQKYLPHAIHEAKRRFFMHYQGRTTTPQEYLEQFKSNKDVLDLIGATITPDLSISNTIPTDELTLLECKNLAREQYFAVAFLFGADRYRYRKLIEDLENAYLQGQDNYPKTVNEARL
jgi:hypothetical protein